MTVELRGDLWNGILERNIAKEEARVMLKIAQMMEQKIIRFTPKDTGELRSKYVIGSEVEPKSITVTLGNRAPHTLDVAHGTTGHSVPRSEILRWVERNIDKRKKYLTKRKRWIKKKIREEKAQRKRKRRKRSATDKLLEKKKIIDAATTMTIRAIKKSGTQARRMGRKAAELGRKIHAREQRKALRKAIKKSAA